MINLSGIDASIKILNAKNVIGTNINDANARQENYPVEDKTMDDKVTISAAAKLANDLEKFSLPDWINSYVAPLNDLSSSYAEVQAGGKYQSISDPKEAQRFLKNEPTMKQFHQNYQQGISLKAELRQYSEYYGNAYQAAMNAIGVTEKNSYNDIVANNPSVANRAQAVFKEAMLSHPGISALMSRLEVPIAKDG